jgi:hypothetical protein
MPGEGKDVTPMGILLEEEFQLSLVAFGKRI